MSMSDACRRALAVALGDQGFANEIANLVNNEDPEPPAESGGSYFIGQEVDYGGGGTGPPAENFVEIRGQLLNREGTHADLFAERCPEKTGTTSSGVNTITGLTDALSWARPGAEIEADAAFVPGTTIVSVDSDNQVTVSDVAMSTGPTSIRFFAFGGVGDGSTTWTLDDARGRTNVAVGQSAGLSRRYAGEQFGSETHQLAESELPAHSHSVDANSSGPNASTPSGNSFATAILYNTGAPDGEVLHPGTIQSTGGGASHPNVQPSRGVRRFVCYAV